MKILSSAEDETYISIELKKTVTWRGSSDGSVRYGERSSICGVCSLSHDILMLAAMAVFKFFCSLENREPEPTQRFLPVKQRVTHSLENEASETGIFLYRVVAPLCYARDLSIDNQKNQQPFQINKKKEKKNLSSKHTPVHFFVFLFSLCCCY